VFPTMKFYIELVSRPHLRLAARNFQIGVLSMTVLGESKARRAETLGRGAKGWGSWRFRGFFYRFYPFYPSYQLDCGKRCITVSITSAEIEFGAF